MYPLQMLAKCPLANCPLTKCLLAKRPLAKCPLAICPGFVSCICSFDLYSNMLLSLLLTGSQTVNVETSD